MYCRDMNGVSWLVWFGCCAGFAKLLAMSENSIHGLAFSRPTLQRIRGTHNVLLCAYPWLVGWALGVSAAQSAGRFHWAALAPQGWLLLGAGGVGLVALITSAVRYQRYRPPSCERVTSSRVVDIAARTPESLIGSGRARWLARLPGNEQFTLAVSEKEYWLPDLPAEWDGLSVVHFSDVHFRGSVTRRYFEEVMEEAAALRGDLCAFTGDLLDRWECLEWTPHTFGKLSAPLGCYFVLGNHDWYLGNVAEIRQRLRDAGWQDVAGRVVEIRRGASRLWLAGTERPWMGTEPDLETGGAGLFKILLSHSPDQIDWARRRGVQVMLAGHTHGGQIRLPILGPVYSPSVYDCRYASGVFQLAPTLLAVSRGVSGREPVRYNCRPELTKLILRSAAAEGGSPPGARFGAASR